MKQPEKKWDKPQGQPQGPSKPQQGWEQERKPQHPNPHEKDRHKK